MATQDKADSKFITFELKLKPTCKQIKILETQLFQFRSVKNTALTKCFLSLRQGYLITPFDLISLFSGHGKKVGLNQDAIAEACKDVHKAFDRWLNPDESGKKHSRPRRKSKRNKVKSIKFGQASKLKPPKDRRIGIPGVGKVRCSKQELPEGKIVGGKAVKRASGFYFQYTLKDVETKPVSKVDKAVGIDPGFKTLLTTSDQNRDFVKIKNPKELRKSEERIGQAQRGKNKKLTARLHERVANQRKDRNHKVSRDIVNNYSEIYISDDNWKGMANLFGKSIADAGLGDLCEKIFYKAQTCGRKFVKVPAKDTTRTCGDCGSLTGPRGLHGLKVRTWNCNCGSVHDRDVNSAYVILSLGRGTASVEKI